MFNSEDNTHTHSFVKYIYKVFKFDLLVLLLYEAKIIGLQTHCEKGKMIGNFLFEYRLRFGVFLDPEMNSG